MPTYDRGLKKQNDENEGDEGAIAHRRRPSFPNRALRCTAENVESRFPLRQPGYLSSRLRPAALRPRIASSLPLSEARVFVSDYARIPLLKTLLFPVIFQNPTRAYMLPRNETMTRLSYSHLITANNRAFDWQLDLWTGETG